MNSNTLKNIGIFILALVVAWLLFDGCGKRKTVAEYKQRTDSLATENQTLRERIRQDSIAYAGKMDSQQLAQQELQDERAILTGHIQKTEARINQLIAEVRRGNGGPITSIIDSNKIAECCIAAHELADSTESLVRQNRELTQVNESIEANYQQQLLQSDTALTNIRARLNEALKNFDTSIGIIADLRKDMRRTGNQVYVGASGIYSPVQYGAGATLMLKTARDKLYGVTYYITNGKPVYEARALFKISFRR